jgi:UDP-N-acetylmuramoyl-tripeptide--D-alanyl-D-alanine ligase
MKTMTLGEIARAVQGKLRQGDEGTPVRAVSIDSRSIAGGELFFALRGQRHDGHDFVPGALAAGAAGAVVERMVPGVAPGAPLIQVENTLTALQRLASYNRNAYRVPVIGITGSSGKTSTKDLVAAALSRRFVTLKTTGNRNNEIGLPLTLLELDERFQAVVVEMAMRGPGEIAFLCRLARPTGAVITNIGEAHIERLGSVDNIARAKGEILEAIGPGGFALLHRDSPYISREAARCRGRVYFFGIDGEADILGRDIRAEKGGSRFKVRVPGGEEREIFLPLPGRHNVENALAAIGVAWALGISLEDIAAGLAGAALTPMRLEQINCRGLVILNDAYNANPSSTRAALQVLAAWEAEGRRIAVLGDMLELGGEARRAHYRAGSEAAGVADYLVVVGSLARFMADGALAAGMPGENIFRCVNNAEAAEILETLARPGDVILVKGSRGMRMEEIVQALIRGQNTSAEGKT